MIFFFCYNQQTRTICYSNYSWNFLYLLLLIFFSFAFFNACSSSGYSIRAWHLLMLRSKCHARIWQPCKAQGIAIILLLSAGRESASFSLFFFALLAHACRRAWRPYSRTNGRRPWGREVVAMHTCMHGPATQKGRGRMMHSARPADKRRKIVFYSLKCRWGFSA